MRKRSISIFLITFLIFFSTISTSLAHSLEKPNLFSETAILIDAKSGQILYEKNAKKKMYPASITKIVTGIIAIEEGDLDDFVSVSKEAIDVDGTRVYLVENEKVKLKRLVQGLLINSGNDAGIAIAEYFSGNELSFAERMNDFVRTQIGITDTNFTNPHGLFDENHYTTAFDMAKISQYAMENDIFKEIVGTKELEWNGEGWKTTIYNHHRLLWDYEGVTGIKNGYVSQSGYTLVTSAERNGMELIAVTLNAPTSQSAYNDTTALLEYGFNNFTSKVLSNDQIYLDEDGNRFKINSEKVITVPKDEEVLEEIQGNSLFIKKKDGYVIFEQELQKLIDPSDKFRIKQEKEVFANEHDFWLWKILHPYSLCHLTNPNEENRLRND